MKRACFHFLFCGILAHAFALAQQSSDSSSNTLAYENGSIANNTYTNECFGLSLPIPDGWQLNSIGTDGKARHIPGGGLVLLIFRQPQEGTLGNTIVVTARDPVGLAPTAQEFVSNSVHGQINLDPEHRELLRDTDTVDYGGKHFFRASYKQLLSGRPLYVAFVYTKLRGYYIGETLTAGSPEGLEESAKSLQQISFRDDEPNPKCVMAGDDNSTGVIAGVVGSAPGTSASGLPQRVRVSQAVSEGLLVKRVSPHYPELAQLGRIQGRVVLKGVDRHERKRQRSQPGLRPPHACPGRDGGSQAMEIQALPAEWPTCGDRDAGRRHLLIQRTSSTDSEAPYPNSFPPLNLP
jgi:hypothetical protein